MAGPPMPMLLLRVAMMTSQQPSSAALPAKQRPDTTPTSGTRPLSLANCTVEGIVEAGHAWEPVGVAGPPAAAFGSNSTSGRRNCSATSNMRSVLRWLIWPCVPASTV